MRVCLASTSPARLMLLRQAGIDPLTLAPDVDEDALAAAAEERVGPLAPADLVLLPMQPSPADLWASGATLEIARAEKRRAVVLLNRVPAAGKLPEKIEAELARQGIPVLAERLGNRTAYASAFMNGLAVCEAAPRTQAAAELRALAEAVRGLGEN